MYSDEQYIKQPIEIKNELVSFFKFYNPKLILDIGSCDGLDSIKYSQMFPDSSIFAFEPLLKNQLLIKQNIRKYHVLNIKLIDRALSNIEGEAEFYVSSGRPDEISEDVDWDFGNKSSSLLEPNRTMEVHPWLKFQEKVTVQTDTLENFMKTNQFDSIDFIHMDVQGAELMVLKGAGTFISKIKMIWLEVENIELYKNQPLTDDVEKFLVLHGFSKIKDTVNSIAGDQLWVNYKFFPRKYLTSTLYKLYNKVFN